MSRKIPAVTMQDQERKKGDDGSGNLMKGTSITRTWEEKTQGRRLKMVSK